MTPERYPKVLLISHNALSSVNNNGKTIETFFKNWPKNYLAHLFFSPEAEDFSFCDNSYCINDYDALDNFLRFRKVDHGLHLRKYDDSTVCKKNYLYLVKKYFVKTRTENKVGVAKVIHDNAIARKPLICLFRELIWRSKNIGINSIFKWIEEFEPDVIFFQGGGASYSYEIVLNICKEFKLPLVLQLTDDYTKPLYQYSVINRYCIKKYLHSFKKAIHYSHGIIAISDKMKKEYRSLYGGNNYEVLSNSTNRFFERANYKEIDKYIFLYAGNLGLNRWMQIEKIGKALDVLSAKKGLEIQFNVLSATKLNEQQKKSFDSINSICMKGFVDTDELDRYVANSHFLVHVESFDKVNRRITRLSISTKLGEYLSSNRCIIAVGPNDIASIEYIQEKKIGKVFNDITVDELSKGIECLIENPIQVNQYLNNGYREYCERFDEEIISNKIYNMVTGAIK